MNAKATGELIAACRKALEMSQAELAARIHVTDKAVSRWETGRGMPAIDSLEPLAAALGLSVSELLSGKRLTPEELPKTAGGQIVEGMRQNARCTWLGALGTLLAMTLLASAYLSYHYCTTVPFFNEHEADREALAEKAESYMNQWDQFAPGSLSVVDLEQRGDYLTALCVEEDGSGWDLCIYDRDPVFSDRWRANGSLQGMQAGEISSWNFGSPKGEAVIVFGGWNLPGEIKAYSFQNGGITYTCSTGCGGMLLDVFVIPENYDRAPHNLTLLDENSEPLPYINPWLPGLPD
jgi:transcriptional regulator with XRE-family HTH domain